MRSIEEKGAGGGGGGGGGVDRGPEGCLVFTSWLLGAFDFNNLMCDYL